VALLHVPLDQITETHLASLIDAKAPETLYIDYKREIYGGNDAARREFLADVSSFANMRGGDLVIGAQAANGIPIALSAFTGDADAELLRLDSMARTGLEPRIPNLHMRAVPIASGGAVLVIRVPRSFRLPHRVIFGGSNRFWARSSGGKYEPNVEELRALFVLAPELAERMRAFRFDRVASIAAGETPVPLQSNCCLVLHVVPFSNFDLRPALSLPCVSKKRGYITAFGADYANDARVNFDGLLTLTDHRGGPCRAYTQVFRAGAIEGVDSEIVRPSDEITPIDLDLRLINYTRVYTTLLRECGAEPPYTVMASVVGVRGKRFTVFDYRRGSMVGHPADRDQLHLREVVLEEVPAGNPECAAALRPMLDQLANAAGVDGSPSFDQDGKWRG
jgi:hypothetical protein